MSGSGFMEVVEGSPEVDGCSELESSLCHDFSDCVVRRAAGVVAGVKPAALFNFVPRLTCDDPCPSEGMCAKVAEVIEAYQRELPRYGVELMVLYASKHKVALFAYRADLLAELLNKSEERRFLAEAGYDVGGVDELVGSLWVRMHAYYEAADFRVERPAYPHEVGLLLGYPLEDVRGFIRGDSETCRGPWKAYGDARVAQVRFGRLAMHEARCQALYAAGSPFNELFGSSLGV